jgi:DNA-binding GntR family transcriptional regulator
MTKSFVLDRRSLKEQVYDHLRGEMQRGRLEAGSFLDMDGICGRLGVSKTPLREALLQLEMEDFVTILPRRGVRVNGLSLDEIRNDYEIIGALEAKALRSSFARLKPAEIKLLESLVQGMDKALRAGNFDLYYERNLRFHDVYLEACGNPALIKVVRTIKKRLYDFPRRSRFVKEWEQASIGEHRQLLRLIREGRREEAVRFIEDVHWSFRVQEPFIRKYYAPSPARKER